MFNRVKSHIQSDTFRLPLIIEEKQSNMVPKGTEYLQYEYISALSNPVVFPLKHFVLKALSRHQTLVFIIHHNNSTLKSSTNTLLSIIQNTKRRAHSPKHKKL